MNYLHRCALRHPRSTLEAFPQTAEYGAAIEKPAPKSHRALRFAAWGVVAWFCLMALAGGVR
jgi:hypothetical protein